MPQLAVKMTGAPGYPAWYVPTAGKLARKVGDKGAGSWVIPAAMKVKHIGLWEDTGYVGYPGTPSTPTVQQWDSSAYNDMTATWNAPTTGAPVVAYELQVQQNAPAGSTRTFVTASEAIRAYNFGVSASTKYSIFVRSIGATGLYSAWTAALKVSMGKAAVTTYHNEQRNQAWDTGNYSYDCYRGQWGGVTIPSASDYIHCTNMGHGGNVNAAHFCNNSGTVGRYIDVFYKGFGGYGGTSYRHPDHLAASILESLGMDAKSGEWVGFHALDVGGWSYQPPGVHMWGSFNLHGKHYYTVSVGVTTPAVANGYW